VTKARKPTTWSYSAASQYMKCPKQYEYARVERLPQPSSPALERGNRVHAQLERALRADATDAGVPEVSLIDYVAELRSRQPVVEEMWHFDRDWQFVGTEFTPRSWLLVKMDAYVPPVVGKKARNAHVVDWKTGRQYPEHELQGELYAVAVAAKEGERVRGVDVDMVYVDQAHVEKWTLELGGGVLEEAQSEWRERAEKMLGDTTYRATPGRACNWCPFSGRKGGPCRAG
jgi:CRISPR/Cas system-associated exonuclease Cas4 (RecB family)